MGVVQTKEVRSTAAASMGGGVSVYLVNETGVVQGKVRSTTAASTTPLVSAAATVPIPPPAALTAAVLDDVELADLTNWGDDVAVDASRDDSVGEGVLGSENDCWVGEDGGDRGGTEGVPGSRGAEGVGEDAGDSGGPEGVSRSRSSEGTGEEEGNRGESWEDGGWEAEVEALTVEKVGRKEKVRPLYPRRPGQPDCKFFVESGYCKFKADCKFNHPPNRRKSSKAQYIKQPDIFQVAEKQKNVAQQSAIQPEHEDADVNSNLEGEKRIKYPQRPDATDCTFYTKTGTCKFGSTCRFNHPPGRKKNKEKVEKHSEHIQKDSEMSGNLKEGDMRIKYPQRPDATDCTFYMKTGTCKFGSACRFNHPHDKKKNKEKVGSQSEHIQVGAKKQQTSKQSVTSKKYMDVKEKSKEPSTKSFGQTEKHYTNPRASKFEIPKNSNHHGVKKAPSVALNFLNLPIRPGAKECPQYMSEGCCKFGVNCMHHHPDPTVTSEPVSLSQYQDGQCAQQFGYGVSPTPGTPWHVSTSYTTGMHPPFGFYPNTE